MGILRGFGQGLGFVGAFIPGYGTLAATAGALLTTIDGPDGSPRALLPPGDPWLPGGLAWGLPWEVFTEYAGWRDPLAVGFEAAATVADDVGHSGSPTWHAAKTAFGPFYRHGSTKVDAHGTPIFGSAGEAIRRGSPHHFDLFNGYLSESRSSGSNQKYSLPRREWIVGETNAHFTCQGSTKGCPVGFAQDLLKKIRNTYQADWPASFHYYLDLRWWRDSGQWPGVARDSFGASYPTQLSYGLNQANVGSFELMRAHFDHWVTATGPVAQLALADHAKYQAARTEAVVENSADQEEWLAWRDAAKTLAAKETASGQLTEVFEAQFEAAYAAGHTYLDSISIALQAITANVAGVQASVLEAAVQNPGDNDAVAQLIQETADVLADSPAALIEEVAQQQAPTSQAPAPASELERKPLPLVAAALVAGALLLA